MVSTCPCCQEEFRQRRVEQIFCSHACRNRANAKKKYPDPDPEIFRKPCKLCGKVFDATPSRPRYDSPKKYCDKGFVVGRTLSNRRRITKTCKNCGKEFEIHRAWATRKGRGKHTGQFCSRPCVWEFWRKEGTLPTSRKKVGDGTLLSDGYIELYLPHYPYAREEWESGIRTRYARGHIKEHRYVMEQKLGRKLHPWENIHHQDGNRTNNDRSNLELWVKTQPSGIRLDNLVEGYSEEVFQLRLRISKLESQLHLPQS